MAKKEFSASIASIVSGTAAVESRHGLRLSDVVQEPITKLRPNPLNTKLFDREEATYLEQLQTDIRERGILVPLIAKADGTLLAGHNRLQAAHDIGLRVVPVQYVEESLTPDAEQKFVINDNLLRRQLSNEQRIKLYHLLYPNFEERIRSAAGRPQKQSHTTSTKNNVDSVHISAKNSTPLTAAQIAKDTGQSVAAVQKQLQRQRQEKAEKIGQKKQEKTDKVSTKEQNNTIDIKFIQGIERQLDKAEQANIETQKALIKVLKGFVKKLG